MIVVGPLTQLMTLPLRLALRGAEMLLRAAGGIAGGDGDGYDGGEGYDGGGGVATAEEQAPRHEPVTRTAEPPATVERPARAERPAPVEPPATPASTPEAEAPDHVSEEPVLVEEVADPGAEDGAGPEISVGEPWPSYASMSASEVIARLEEADPAAVAVARLYEHANRGRKTVLAAADRRLKALDS
ncbi:MAG: hypothetical protein ACJ760_00600 [Thermoleophilaceae bacterium]